MGVMAPGEDGLHVATDADGAHGAPWEFDEFYRAEFAGLVVLAAADLDPELSAALQSLPTQQRAAMALHYLCDCSLAEIAETLGVAEGTIKTHLQRGRRQLAERLSPSGDQTPSDDRGSTAHD